MAIVNADYSNLNIEEVANSIGIQATYMPKLVNSFLKESKKTLKILKTHIEDLDFQNIKMDIHSIKGSAGNLQFKEIHDMAREMELAALHEDKNFDYKGYRKAIKNAISTIKELKESN